MHALKVMAKTNKDGYLHLDVLTGLPGKKVELVVVIHEVQKKKGSGFDFNDLIGQLSWAGDPVKMQRAIRDEW